MKLPQYYAAGSLAAIAISMVESPVDLFKIKLQIKNVRAQLLYNFQYYTAAFYKQWVPHKVPYRLLFDTALVGHDKIREEAYRFLRRFSAPHGRGFPVNVWIHRCLFGLIFSLVCCVLHGS